MPRDEEDIYEEKVLMIERLLWELDCSLYSLNEFKREIEAKLVLYHELQRKIKRLHVQGL